MRDGAPPSMPVLELQVARVEQLFDSLDPTPFRERDLDPRAEEYIADWAREQPAGRPLALRVRIGSGDGAAAAVLPAAVASHFRNRAQASRQQLRRLLRTGRTSLAIGLAVAAAATVAADLVSGARYGILTESLVIGGWVAMWRPLEIFLYDWWPIRAEARLYDRLAALTVHVVDAGDV